MKYLSAVALVEEEAVGQPSDIPQMNDNQSAERRMASHLTHPKTKPDIDDEARRILEERLLTIDTDAKDSVSRNDRREEIRKTSTIHLPRNPLATSNCSG